MTIREAIDTVDNMKPNQFTESEKIKWLSILDGLIKAQVIDLYEDVSDKEFNGYTDETPMDTVLLVGEPYDEIYIFWLMSKMAMINGETVRYNNMITAFNDLYGQWTKDYNRNRMPKRVDLKYF